MSAIPSLVTSSPVARIAGKAHHAVDDAAGLAAPVIERASAAAHRTIDKVAETAGAAAGKASRGGEMIKARSAKVAESCGDYVKERPLASVAGALAIGYLVGRLMR